MFLAQPDVQIEQWENYQKQGHMNRCKILGAESILTLSVPLVGGREQKTLVKEIRINNATRWHTDQLRAIKSCYGKAPFFDYYFEPIEKLLTKNNGWLLELNMEALALLIGWLRWQGSVTSSATFLNANALEIPIANPQLIIPNSQPPVYLQVFADRVPFTTGLSVMDVLFCQGPEAKNLLKM